MSGFDCAALSQAGTAADTNEDAVAMHPEIGVFAVADGVGGRPGGDRASSTAAGRFVEHLRPLAAPARLEDSHLRDAVAQANEALLTMARQDPLLAGLASTLAALVTDGRHAKIVHVGDSRVYRFADGRLVQLTTDHTVVMELVSRNLLSSEAARKHQLRNVLSRSIGMEAGADPDIAAIELSGCEVLILATDGFSKSVAEEQVVELLSSSADADTAEQLCRKLMCLASASPAPDNISIAVVRIQGPGTE